MKRTAAVFFASLVIILYVMSYTHINAEEDIVTDPLPVVTETAETTARVIDIPKPVETAETETETEPETTGLPPEEETTEEITETEPVTEPPPPAETTAPVTETTAAVTEPETVRETVPPPETIQQETRAPVIVVREPQDKAVAKVTVALNPPETIKPVKAASTAVPAQTTAAITAKVTADILTVTEAEPDAEETVAGGESESFAVETSGTETDSYINTDSGPELTARNIVVIGAGSAVVTALLFIYRFARHP